MFVKGRYYSICQDRYSRADDHTVFYVSRCNINDRNGVVIGHVTVPIVPKTCDGDRAKKHILLEIERMMTAKTLVLEEVPVFIECEGMFFNRRVFGRRI